MEHEPQRDAGALGDACGSGAEVALAEEIKERIDDGMARASGASEATVDAGEVRHQAAKVITSRVQLQVKR
jgi:hypothetical protein